MSSNHNKYLKYRKKQELLNRKQISIILEEDLAKIFQEEIKSERRLLFEDQLKTHFSKRQLVKLFDKSRNHYDHNLDQFMRHIDILLPDLQDEFQSLNEKIETLCKKLENFINPLDKKDTELFDREVIEYKIREKVQGTQEKSTWNKIPDLVLKLAMELYKDLNSWKKVSQKLANQGHLSYKNKPYTSSGLSRAISKYRESFKKKLG